ncbi:MAG TPA: hypothetical protein PKX15_00330 [Bacteroidales bacterium]|nr:hypothetical protein [Bacteroidales bacterium]
MKTKNLQKKLDALYLGYSFPKWIRVHFKNSIVMKSSFHKKGKEIHYNVSVNGKPFGHGTLSNVKEYFSPWKERAEKLIEKGDTVTIGPLVPLN